MSKSFTIIKVRKGYQDNVNLNLQWVGNSLGLFGERDKDSSCFRIFITLVKTSRYNKPLSSDQIANKLELSRGTVVHHLNKLIDKGIVNRSKEGYILKENNLEEVIKDIKNDIKHIFDQLEDVAKNIDNNLG
jgi:predicted transcriptional regulator